MGEDENGQKSKTGSLKMNLPAQVDTEVTEKGPKLLFRLGRA